MNSTLTWSDILGSEKEQNYFKDLLQFLAKERAVGKIIYPAENEIFSAFRESPYKDIKVVILGQDPYHGAGQAHGLSFSVKPNVKPPPSLKNIFLELKNDLNIPMPKHGYLKKWANQGVLLLNTALTVEESKPQAHAKIGWTRFTDKVIEKLNEHTEPLVFMLWGAHAKNKGALLNNTKHLVLTAAHPSPFSVKGFLGCKHFSKANNFLIEKGRQPIDWAL